MSIILILLLLFKSNFCEDRIERIFNEINEVTVKFNAIGADIAWRASLDPGNPEFPRRAATYQKTRNYWQQTECKRLEKYFMNRISNLTQERQYYLLCREPKFRYSELREVSAVYEELQYIYTNVIICIPHNDPVTNITTKENAIEAYIYKTNHHFKFKENYIHFAAKIAANNFIENGMCLKGEEDFEKLMEYSRKPDVLEWVWLAFREKIKIMKQPYENLINLENEAARRNGYTDIGAYWREELEIPNLRRISRRLYKDIKPLYALLHGVVRFYLRQKYGDIIPEKGPIPAHLLGNLWSENWEPLANLILPRDINLDDRIKNLNWTVQDMVKKAEDFYMSLGLPPMTETFWRESVLSRENHSLARCHGSAADMFKDGDYRLLYCSGVSFNDFYVIHHELGHIQYYMAYKNQPGLFRQANSALHETIGDTIMYAVMTPQHLHRLRLINDSELYNTWDTHKDDNNLKRTLDNPRQAVNEGIKQEIFDINTKMYHKTVEELEEITTDDILILKQALSKLPQIPFSLLIDEYRWKYFEGSIDKDNLNEEFWAMAKDLQGIEPSGFRGEEYFDIGAKFHVPDNTPYIRYFLSSFLQHQLFESLCKAAVFGNRNVKEPLPPTMQLHRCDIYGSKAAGRILKDLLSRGHSQHWRDILRQTMGVDDISSSSLKRYYYPLKAMLTRLVQKHNIPIGW